MITELAAGIRRTGAVTNITAILAANAQTIYQISNYAGQIGTKSVKLKKLMLRNNAAGGLWLRIGTGVGAAFVDLIPPIQSLNNLDAEYTEAELPSREAYADITCYCDSAGLGGGSVDVQLEVEERG